MCYKRNGLKSYQLSTDITSSISIIVVRKTKLTIILCIYILALCLTCIKQLFTDLFLYHFRTTDSDAHTHLWSLHNSDRNQPNNHTVRSIRYFNRQKIGLPFMLQHAYTLFIRAHLPGLAQFGSTQLDKIHV